METWGVSRLRADAFVPIHHAPPPEDHAMTDETKPATKPQAASNSGTGKSFLLGLVVGVIIGAFAGVLLPEVSRMGGGDVPAGDGTGVPPTTSERNPGLETPSADEVQDDAADAIESAADDAQDAAGDAVDAVGDAVDDAADAVDDAAGNLIPPGDG
ncbi:MAG: hypothetical protein AAF297_11690 [Planctomycetota bacterium]